ncbi:kinase domain protein [Ceratobasidium sp. AG-Ba]|nr:kinase domain protein [Ceratobasidium sp. AG-Ba]
MARGGFSDIWKARLHGQPGFFAIKCLRLHAQGDGVAKHVKRVTREAMFWQTASKTKHQNILALEGFTIFRGQLALVSRWMSNGKLTAYIAEHPGIDRWYLCEQIAVGLSYLHELGIIHGDLKGANVFVSCEGVVKLGDFGNAFDPSCYDFTTASNGGLGTTRWMAPELLGSAAHQEAEGASPSKPTDVFALGMTILEIVSGEIPYHECKSNVGVVMMITRGKTPLRPTQMLSHTRFGDVRWALLSQCWAMRPSDRPTATQARGVIRSLL